MVMTNEEIVRHYRQAKDPQGSIQILADLNATKKDEILAILVDAGMIEPQEAKQKVDRQRNFGFNSELAMQLYEQGLIDREVAEQVGVSHCTIFMWRKNNNLPANNPHRGGGRKDDKNVKKIMETQPAAERTENAQVAAQLVNPVLLKIQKLLDMVSEEDSPKVCGQYLDLMITMLSDEVQHIANAE